MNTVICIKLTTSEDLIAKATDNVANAHPLDEFLKDNVAPTVPCWVTLKDARVIQPMLDPQGNIRGMVLAPWTMGHNDAEFTVDLSNVAIALYKPHPDLVSAYEAQTSPIQIAKALPGTGSLIKPAANS